MNTAKCEICGGIHGLFYKVTGEDKKTLNYRCNKATKKVDVKGQAQQEHRKFTKTVCVEFIEGLKIPEEWTRKWRKQWQEAHQYKAAI